MKTEEFKKILDKAKVKPCSRFTLEEAMMQMYRIADDLSLALDEEERKAVIRMHLMRTDDMFEVFEDMVLRGKIL
jgi:hypothetical protein